MSWIDSWSARTSVAELREQSLAELAQRQVGGVEDEVGLAADRLEHPALLGDRGRDPVLVAERMAMTGLAEPPDQDVVARLEEDDPRADAAALERAAHGRQGERGVAGADVEHDRDVANRSRSDDTSSARSGSSSPGRLSTTV